MQEQGTSIKESQEGQAGSEHPGIEKDLGSLTRNTWDVGVWPPLLQRGRARTSWE